MSTPSDCARSAVAVVLCRLVACATGPPLAQLDPPAREARLASDAAAVAVYRAGLRDVVAYVDARPDLFARDRSGTPTIPPREAREAVWAAWQRFLDYLLALDTIGRAHQRFAELAPPDRERSFAIGHAAFVASVPLRPRAPRPPRPEPRPPAAAERAGARARAPEGHATPASGSGSSTWPGAPSSPPSAMVDEDTKAAAPPALAAGDRRGPRAPSGATAPGAARS